ncbi:MAG: NAD(P)/FAD-dependent oxidoreductase [Bacteroidales bacterium]|nr:NAD(P)/FAD-dependent oxidoreductase [Lentimicrobiaceae bacterium]MDD5694437.1 NAD(P)/FAD-dependent oxidoreductase [Bacteroidales bacterium]
MEESIPIPRIPRTDRKRVVIVGGGFAGLKLAMLIPSKLFQVILLDRNNYHQFQPLLYQVATAGLEPSSISFPLRKIFQNRKHIHFRVAEVTRIDPIANRITADIGSIHYDYLVLAMGASTNFFGIKDIARNAIAMKSTSEALYIRNTILQNYEKALNTMDEDEAGTLMNIVVVGGGPTGVELAGALAEMKRYVLPKDYPELDFSKMQVYLFEANQRLLMGMSSQSSERAKQYLEKLGVRIRLNAYVKRFDGQTVTLREGDEFRTRTLLWAAGIQANSIEGFPVGLSGQGGRLLVDEYNRVTGFENIFAIGDMAIMTSDQYPSGHPQVAQVAIQQARCLARNLENRIRSRPLKRFRYKDKGSLATIGRNMAVADLPHVRLHGFIAWLVWIFVHLMAILGQKNRLFIFINWFWNYWTYDQSLRLILREKNNH